MLSSAKPKSIKLDPQSYLISQPEADVIYRWNNLTVRFSGDLSSSLGYALNSGEMLFERRLVSKPNPLFHFLGIDSLPQSWKLRLDRNCIYFYANVEENILRVVKNLKVNVRFYFNFDIQQEYKFCGKFYFVRLANDFLQQKLQKILPRLPITIGEYPIFLETRNPEYSYLAKLYNEFLAYNNDQKLQYQNKKSAIHCYARAQVVSLVLNHYGITNYKIFKVWHLNDWRKFNGKKTWYYHVAPLIFDSNNNPWVWDPWEGLNRNLLPLKSWVYRFDEPPPKKVTIANSSVISDYNSGGCANFPYYATNFNIYSPQITKIFQFLCGDMIPNSPCYSINTSNPWTLFAKKRSIPANYLEAKKSIKQIRVNKTS